VKRIGLDGTADRKGSFLNDIAVDEARKVAWPAADQSQATGRVKRHDNQLHRARVLEVRIQSPPAESPQTIGSSAVASERKLAGFVPELMRRRGSLRAFG